jgi:ssDNA-binding Zn-finger/Zn-ribbon topoisomerase 1
MVIRLAKKGPNSDVFFWGCSSYPICTNTLSTLLKNENWPNHISNFCSDPFCTSSPRTTDWQRHSSLNTHYQWDHIFLKDEIEKLTGDLGFNSINEFIFWICTQNQFEVSHNTFPVPSPYTNTFRNLTTSVDEHFNQILQDTTIKTEELGIAINEWEEHWKLEAERNRPYLERRAQELEIKIQNQVRNRKNRERRLEEIQNFRKLSYDDVKKNQTELRKLYQNSNAEDRLNLVVDDINFPPEYYPIEWFRLNKIELYKLDIILINKLLDKLHTRVKGERKKFKAQLLKAANRVDGLASCN